MGKRAECRVEKGILSAMTGVMAGRGLPHNETFCTELRELYDRALQGFLRGGRAETPIAQVAPIPRRAFQNHVQQLPLESCSCQE